MHNKERHYDLDAMRSILMSLGIILHTANVFSSNEWAVKNIETSPIFDSIIHLIHLFRMPAFFIISGFFVHYTYVKKGYKIFLNQRLPRIIIPLIVTALTLNSLQYILLNTSVDLFTGSYWIQGKWVSHLWFLNSLIYYFLASVLVMVLIPNYLDRISHTLKFFILGSKGIYVLTLPLLSMVLIKLSYITPEPDKGFYDLSLSESVLYSCYFIFGTILGASRDIYNQFISKKTILILISLVLTSYLLSLSISSIESIRILNIYIKSATTWLLCSLIFFMFNRYMNYQSKFFTYMADASYTIYLFHHIFVILLSLYIVNLDLPITIKFILIITAAFVMSNAVHYFFIQRVSWLKWLFNGKRI